MAEGYDNLGQTDRPLRRDAHTVIMAVWAGRTIPVAGGPAPVARAAHKGQTTTALGSLSAG